MPIDASIPLSYRPSGFSTTAALQAGSQTRSSLLGEEQQARQNDLQRVIYTDQMLARAARMGSRSAEEWDQAFTQLAQEIPEAQQYIGKWTPFAARELSSSIAAAPGKAAAAQSQAQQGGGIAAAMEDPTSGVGFGGGGSGSNKNIAQPSGAQVDLSTLSAEQRNEEFRKLRIGMDALRQVRTVQDFDAAIDRLAPEMPNITRLKGMFNELTFAEGVQLLHTRLKDLHDQLAPTVLAGAAGAPVREAQPGVNVQYTEAGPVVATTPVGGGEPSFKFADIAGSPRKEFMPPPKSSGGGGAGGATGVQPTLLPVAIDTMAERVIAGDKSALQGLGRGVQGSANLVAIQNRVAEIAKERNMSGADIARLMAQFEGLKSGFRAIGTKSARVLMGATEAGLMADIVLSKSDLVDRTEFPDLNAIANAVAQKTGDANIVALNTAINSFVNVYAAAISTSPGGSTISDKDHAREMLNAAFTQGQLESVVGVMLEEIEAAKKSPKEVKEQFGEDFMATPGKDGKHGDPDKPGKKPSWVP